MSVPLYNKLCALVIRPSAVCMLTRTPNHWMELGSLLSVAWYLYVFNGHSNYRAVCWASHCHEVNK